MSGQPPGVDIHSGLYRREAAKAARHGVSHAIRAGEKRFQRRPLPSCCFAFEGEGTPRPGSAYGSGKPIQRRARAAHRREQHTAIVWVTISLFFNTLNR